MENEIIGVKELYKNFKKITEKSLKGQSFLVVRNSKPIFRIEPIKKGGDKKYTLKDAEKMQFTAKDKNLSKKIDGIVY